MGVGLYADWGSLLPGSSAGPEVLGGSPRSIPKVVLTPFPGPGRRGVGCTTHNTQRGWTNGLEEAQGIRIEVPSCRKTEGKGEGGTLAPQQPSPRGLFVTAGTDLI